MSVRFTKIDNLTRSQHRFLDENDDCSFIGEFTARKGYSHSETNNRIISFKMKPSIRLQAPYRYKHKGSAIDYWARQLSSAMPVSEATKAIWVPIPGSCPVGNPEYDDRLLRLLHRAYSNRIQIVELLSQLAQRVAAHDSDARPTPEVLIDNWVTDFSLLPVGRYNFVVFDDVLTRGASFKAAKRVLSNQYPGSAVSGVFLARTVHDDGPMFDFEILAGFDE
ncbi:hypothetical protein [Mesorhizobium sp. B2-3-15]|uniref:hypothetical protein n=1 Tax=Mesorhizobium sp. B2-3-15 TaxID=2589949 RepID=UPI001127DE20|nr:hypothetical protein [Mesorhizobium sp. B2-3-15]TPL77571.1 hypothetical protein FJ954_02605 [Mesorhizobium sp. B2-3-15]